MNLPNWLKRGEKKSTDINTILRRIGLRKNTAAGVMINEETALQSPTFFAAVTGISRTIAQLPLDVVQRDADGVQHKVKNHPLYRLLVIRPNEWQSRYEYWMVVATNLLMHNVFYAFKNQVANGRILNLHPLTPDSVTPEQRPDMKMEYRVAYKDGTIEVVPGNKIHRILLQSADGINPISPIESLKESLGLEIAAEKFGANMFNNGAIPNMILKHPSTFKDNEVYTRFKETWESANKKGGTAILEEGMDVEKVQHSANESQFLETRKLNRSVIAGAMNLSPHRVGDLSRANFSNVENLSLEYVVYSVMPILIAIETAITRDLIPEGQQGSLFVKFNVDGLLRGDTKTRAEALKLMRESGIINANEWRAMEDMNPIEGDAGEIYIRPLNMQSDGEEDSRPETEPNPDQDDGTE